MARTSCRMEEGRCTFKILTGKRIGKRPLGKLKYRWEDDIRMDPKEIAVSTGNWIDSAENTGYWTVLVNVALNLQDSHSM